MLMRYNEKVGHVFVPNQTARLANEKNGYYVKTNSLGFRSDFEFQEKRGNKPRILMFGDSYTAGDNCSNRDRYSDQLGKLLNAEVYNYGVSGTGTDQHLLIYREFASKVEADLIVICVQVDSINRIQVSHRESIDRITGKRLLIPKPFYQLKNGKLELNNVPVPKERPEKGSVATEATDKEKSIAEKALKWYRESSGMSKVRETMRGSLSKAKSKIYKLSGIQPYPDFESENSEGWKLMKAILEQFAEEASPTPVLIVPIPTYEFYLHEASPIYQPRFESLANPGKNVFVANATSPLTSLPWEKRQDLTFRVGGHFSPMANKIVAETMAEFIDKNSLVKKTENKEADCGSQETVASLPHKSKNDHYVLGISCFYHNSAASLIKNGEIIAAAEEERFSRLKNDRRFPHNAVNYCLEEAGINTCDLDAVIHYDNAPLTFERIMHSLYAAGHNAEKMWSHMLPPWLQYKLHVPNLIKEYLAYDGLVLEGNHHRSHAASAFYPSPFKKAAILTLDGVGEWETASMGVGDGSKIKILKEMNFPNSLGLLYSAFTEFTGFKVNSGEYKMMGLAPYGEPKYADIILEKLIDLKDDGSIELNMDYFDFLKDLSMTSKRFAELFDGPARKQESKITRREMDIAKSIQVVTEEAILRMARTAHKLTGEKNLCIAGGVALNCVANGRLLREGPFENIWIQPAAGDSGCALGTALDAYYTYFGKERTVLQGGLPAQRGSYWGPGFSEDEIRAYLDTHGFAYKYMDDKERADYLANSLADGKVVGHFSGRLEYGPRALGGRSIMGDARNTSMQVDLNLKIKYRESFRPFAPSVLEQDVSQYFELDKESPYMLLVAPVKKERCKPILQKMDDDDMLPFVRQPRSDIPAITHVDYSARVQTVKREYQPAYYDLISAFKDKTGYGVVVNTSFNVRGEPIVCTPADAYRCFMRTEMNILALDNFILLKEDQPEWPEGKGVGLESEEKSNDVEAMYPADFMKSLKKIYKSDFLKTADLVAKENALAIDTFFERKETCWEDANEPDNIRKTFEFAPEMLKEDPTPEKFAEALLAAWKHDKAAKLSKPLVLLLIKLGMQHPIPYDFEEEVPESVYAMF